MVSGSGHRDLEWLVLDRVLTLGEHSTPLWSSVVVAELYRLSRSRTPLLCDHLTEHVIRALIVFESFITSYASRAVSHF